MPTQQDLFSPEWWSTQTEVLFQWAATSGLRIILIVIFLLVALRLARFFVRRAIGIALRPHGVNALDDLMITKRQATLTSLLEAVATIVLIVVAILMIFQEIGFAIAPILASAGVAGVAIGFGAQSLVKDIISGAFIIVERQFSVGDVVRVGDLSGGVEEINLRTIVLRAVDGSVHIIPNGEIKQVTVMTRDWSRLVLDLDVGYGADIPRASAIVKEILEAYAAEHPDFVLEPPEVLGVESLGESSVQIRAWMKMLPGKQWPAGRELRGRIKAAFDEAGIEIPFPQRTLWIHKDDDTPSDAPADRSPV